MSHTRVANRSWGRFPEEAFGFGSAPVRDRGWLCTRVGWRGGWGANVFPTPPPPSVAASKQTFARIGGILKDTTTDVNNV
jgi:hypothetical protein